MKLVVKLVYFLKKVLFQNKVFVDFLVLLRDEKKK